MLDDRHYMRSEYRPPMPMTSILLIANVVCFILQFVLDKVLGWGFVNDWLALSVRGLSHGLVYQLITFQFLHGGLWHLLGNLVGIYFFGRAMEETLGRNGLLKLYLLSGTFGGLLQMVLGFLFPVHFGGAVVGASAGVFGLIAAFAVSHPDQPIMLMFLPIGFPAKYFLGFEAVVAVLGVLGLMEPGVAHGAHLGGMLMGIAYIKWLPAGWSFSLPTFLRRKPSRPRVIITPPKGSWRSSRRPADDSSSPEFITRQVDPILDKISAKGIHSLTEEERDILEAARNRMARR